MEDIARFASDVATWYWWLSVVAVGFAINILSAYAKPAIDRILSKYSSRRREKLLKARRLFQQRVAQLVENPTLLILESNRLTRMELMSLGVLTLLVVLGTFGFVLVQLANIQNPASLTNFKKWAIVIMAGLTVITVPLLMVVSFLVSAEERKLRALLSAARVEMFPPIEDRESR